MPSPTQRPSWIKAPRNIIFTLGCTLIAVLFAVNCAHHEPLDESFLKEYSQFDSSELIHENPTVYQVFLQEEEVGYLILTSHYGYQSDIVMATLVSKDGQVLDARAYSQGETPSYFRKLLGASFFKKNFVNDPIEDGFSITSNVDAVSHATISSNAATRAVQAGVSYLGEHYLHTAVTPHDNTMKVGLLDVLVLVMLILALIGARFSKQKKLVWLCRLYSIVVMGFLAAQFITLTVLLALFSLEWPSIIDYLRWYILVFGTFLLILATGKNVYCSFICPFGALEEVLFSLGGPIGKKPVNPRVTKLLRLIWGQT